MTRIYISSTYEDLVAHREAACKTLRRMGHEPVAMEDYVASDDRPVSKCLADISKCDVYIGIIAWRKGFIPPEGVDEGQSVTEIEYSHATATKKPALIFLLSPAAPWPESFRDSDRSLSEFRSTLEKKHLVSYFENPVDLALLVSIAVRKWEIESGYRAPAVALVDQDLPEELNVISYVPKIHMKLRFHVHWLQHFFIFLVPGSILALVLRALWVSLSSYGAIGAAIWIGIVIFLTFIYPRLFRIRFNFKKGTVTKMMPGAFASGPATAKGIKLLHRHTRRGWQSVLTYEKALRLARTSFYPSLDEARERLQDFAEALNYEMGSHTLDVTVKGDSPDKPNGTLDNDR